MDKDNKQILFELRHIPTPSQQQAVVIATIQNERGVWQGIGAAASLTSGSVYEPQRLIDEASRQARERALQSKEALCDFAPARERDQPSTPFTTPTKQSKPRYSRQHNPAQGNISPNQLNLLTKMTQERNTSLEEETQKQFGTTPRGLSSQQANELIQKLKRRQR